MAKSRLTKAKEISQETKQKVWDRQHGRSISGAALTSVEFHHVIPRSASGVGYEFNIVALTPEEHRWVHDHQPIMVNGKKRYTWDEFQMLMKNHLKLKYEHWSEDRCRFRKYANEEDYGVERKDMV